ncbi:receptor-like protein kinase ANXUR2 isoform X2 [Helianthus annuus]|uniref:receptor-like protein kinase ANXUR2 isoform X2 n=1 Tax=Helianthus annuus TaxID=4232 RepID=UPI001652BDC4|nr:receptor-like protein kinase ANXUR2 isoform X2 [Helianthus annuus]
MSLEDIKRVTQNFHGDNFIGGGGFGKVFKGNLQDGEGIKTIVAKRLDTRFGQGEQQFFSELQILLDYKHENVIGLVGYCDENDEKVLIYEYLSRGSLDRYLNDTSLTWVKRLNICIDVARALDFLHGGVGKQAKETDYIIDHACGTRGYVDPLYRQSGFLTIESDIYSFGVVLFEILCGRSTFAIHKHEGHYLPDFIKNNFEEGTYAEVVFKQIREQIVPKSLTTFQEIAYQCLHLEREKRPTTKEVLVELKKALEFQSNSDVSIIETQVVELSSELNDMNMTGKSENSEIRNKEKMLLHQTDDQAESDC